MDFEKKPFSESHLDSPEYRKRLLRKLNTLIAVLEVACAKVRRSLSGPEPDIERLKRIQANLKDTLQVCIRAKTALERCEKLPADLSESLSQVSSDQGLGLPPSKLNIKKGAAVEMTSNDEVKKFEDLGPIDPTEVRTVNLDDLCRQLLIGDE
jgi:hypothetical protein